ncbi:MAG: N-6 DNA methylase [Marinilabiliaceae bacterium]|nr:N-6 DNA methylase [Marinilabiliaceae bacterium]
MSTTTEITQYLSELNRTYNEGIATETSYRHALKLLFENLTEGLSITNEPKRISCGAPDYIITRKQIPTGYIETKIIGKDLDSKEYQEQFDRYKQSLNNLIITDYITFQLFLNGIEVKTVTIAKITQNGIEPIKSEFEDFITLINTFVGYKGQNIDTAEDLSKIMASKARLMANIIENALNNNNASNSNSLDMQLKGFQEVLIPEIKHKDFADMYAQTIAYGMFAANIQDTDKEQLPWEGAGFNRVKAAQLIPQSNPFLRKFFQYIAGFDLDKRIRWVVDDLADLFNYVNINAIIKEFQKTDHDPIIHFYETFLSEYDPALRKSRGVWYTPKPVVQFIVQAVDDILKQDFEISGGLADASITQPVIAGSTQPVIAGLTRPVIAGSTRPVIAGSTRNPLNDSKHHRVQILDPATGTGTFLAEVVENIYKKFKNQQGMWQNYVHEHLIPRLNGFEILMASYAMAHIKIDMLLKQTGYKQTGNERLRIFLTNSLTEAKEKTELPFAKWLSDEANAANNIKQDVPVMVVLGNPPYSGESQNRKDTWMDGLMKDYKKEASGIKLQEKNSKWINDDYVKFIRFGQYFIENNGEGILAFINNHSFLDNPTFRGMRWNLLKTFDKMYIIDLHGNAKKKETAPDGSKDENVFDIQQGVSINIFVKCKKQSDDHKLAEVYHYDLFGKRTKKFNFLINNTLKTVKWTNLKYKEPYYMFAPKDFSMQKKYEKGFSLQELFPINSVGIVTARDHFTTQYTAEAIKKTINNFIQLDIETAREKFKLGKDARDWGVERAQNDLTKKPDFSKIIEINYRPFDKRFSYYTGKECGFMCRPRKNVMQHFLMGENIGLIFKRGFTERTAPTFISNSIIDFRSWSRPGMQGGDYIAPLYTYIKNGIADNDSRPYHKKHNLNETSIKQFSKKLGLQFTEEKEKTKNTFAPIDILDYIYAVLHNPTYREKYREFLKIDFPRVPYPENVEIFWNLVKLGEKLRHLHLLEGVEPQPNMANFPIAGNNKIEKVQYTINKVYINDTQYFGNVPTVAWVLYIGGYQPAQKWLKDRKERVLNYDDIKHYQKIIVALKETEEIMREMERDN